MYSSLARLALAAIMGLVCAWSAFAEVAKPDSTQLTPAPPLQPSNCPNITWQWYAAGSVPAGYYKANSDGNCYPIPSCSSNQEWSGGSQVCACPAGTSWDSAYSTCHAPCGGGTAWNGSTCASICSAGTAWNGSSCGSLCSGGQSWNGSACACPAGQAWNGSSCGYAPAFTGFSVSPTAVNVGSNYGVSWSTSGSGPVTVTMNCSGATSASYTLSPSAGGSGVVTATAPGTTNCLASAASPWGSTSAASGALNAVCAGGQQWDAASRACVAAVPTLALTGFQLVDPSGTVLQTQPATGAVFSGGLYSLSSNNNCGGGRPMAINMLNQDWNKGINRTIRTVVTGGTPPLNFAYYFTPGAGYTNKDFDFVNGNPYDSQGINYLNANNLPWNSGGYTGPFTGYNDSWGGYKGDLSRPFATRSGYLKGAPSMTVSVVVTDSAGQSVTGTYVTRTSTSVEPYGPSCTAM